MNTSISSSPLKWRKSTRSGDNAGNCVEVGAWRKSFRSQSSTGQCIEVGACNCHGVAIRDTKHHASGTLALTVDEWSGLLAMLQAD